MLAGGVFRTVKYVLEPSFCLFFAFRQTTGILTFSNSSFERAQRVEDLSQLARAISRLIKLVERFVQP